MGMAGSLLPSHDRQTLEPVTLGDCIFKIVPLPELQTYVLLANGSCLAEHSNGFTLKELVSRIAAYKAAPSKDAARVAAQWDYIKACGGMTRADATLDYYLKGEI